MFTRAEFDRRVALSRGAMTSTDVDLLLVDSGELLAWLTEGHYRWFASVRALPDDTELERERLTNWGERLPTRVIIRLMIAHDLYHAGEINHLRALLHGTDRWPYD